MLELLLNLAGIDWQQFVDAAGFKKECRNKIQEAIECLPEAVIDELCKSGSGTCSIFAFSVARRIPNGPEQFIMGEIRRHRAIYSVDGVVVDSSARRAIQLTGAEHFGLQDGKKWRMEGMGTSSSALYFTVDDNDAGWQKFDVLKSHYQGVKNCLKQLLTSRSFVVLFR
ncbi:hypothetical protein PRK78_001665 [Emydomyces testavorans]|uniref:Uncharacterized protein n=1 Tax=Emydomyces testavorans TaxID=2070801 RepID=A0AAF0DEI2_9EURO|nr:hypothetical protein PRK78_001665 [Emydomyces testavorans]